MKKLFFVSAGCILVAQIFSVVAYSLVPSLKALLLDTSGATAAQIALIGTTLPMLFGLVLTPIIGIASDRLRTRFGRRKPFLMLSAPFVFLALLAIGWHDALPFGSHLAVLGGALLMFHLFALIPEGVIYYLIADAIPAEFMGRFYGVNASVSTLFAALFSWFCLDYSVKTPKIAVIIFGALYLVVFFGILPWIKEQKEYSEAQRCPFVPLDFAKETFGQKVFLCMFLCGGLNQASSVLRTMFTLLFATKDLGLTTELIGKIGGAGAVLALPAMLICGAMIDRFHPYKVYLSGSIAVILASLAGYFCINGAMSYTIFALLTCAAYAVQGTAYAPLLMRIFPKERYGQFYSVNSIVCTLIVIAASAIGGKATDILGYRIIFLWDFAFTTLATIILVRGVRKLEIAATTRP